MPRSSKRTVFLICSHQIPMHTSLVSLTCHKLHPFHSAWYYHQNNIWWAVGPQIIKVLRMWSNSLRCYLVLRPKYPSQHSILQHPQPVQMNLTLVMSPSPWHRKLMSHDRECVTWSCGLSLHYLGVLYDFWDSISEHDMAASCHIRTSYSHCHAVSFNTAWSQRVKHGRYTSQDSAVCLLTTKM